MSKAHAARRLTVVACERNAEPGLAAGHRHVRGAVVCRDDAGSRARARAILDEQLAKAALNLDEDVGLYTASGGAGSGDRVPVTCRYGSGSIRLTFTVWVYETAAEETFGLLEEAAGDAALYIEAAGYPLRRVRHGRKLREQAAIVINERRANRAWRRHRRHENTDATPNPRGRASIKP